MQTILLVEDEQLIALDEKRILEKNGFWVITAGNAKEAIEAAINRDVDLVLMDIDLGPNVMDGTRAAEIILQE
jgi:CheY-like chemotaxis protein